jgi:hypothetical protein
MPPVRLLGPPGVAQAGAGREPDHPRLVQISVALGISSSLALALVLDLSGSGFDSALTAPSRARREDGLRANVKVSDADGRLHGALRSERI